MRSDRSVLLLMAAVTSWGIVSLLAEHSYVLQQAQLDTVWRRLLITGALPAALAAVALLFPPVAAAWLTWCLVAAGAIVAEADLAYFRYFGDLISTPALLAAGQLPSVAASARSALRVTDAWMAANLAVAVLLIWRVRETLGGPVSRVARRTQLMIALCAAILAAAGARRGHTEPSVRLDQQYSHLVVAQEYGHLWYHAADTYRFVLEAVWPRPIDPAVEAHVASWLVTTRSSRAASGPLKSALAGHSIVIVLVESLQAFAAEIDIGDRPLMPTLRRLHREGLWFSRILDQSGDGRTSDAEFMLATSLLPMDQGAAAFVFPHHHYISLPRVLRNAGYHTMLAIPFQPDFWNRELTHRAYGFERALFDRDFAPGPAEGWGMNDRDFLSQLAERIAAAPHPLYATAITLSLHHPYDTFPGEMKIGDMGRLEGTRLGNYLHAMRFFDAALAGFIERLQRTGALDRTALIVLGDHDAGLSWPGGLAGLLNAQDPVTRLLHDRVPLLIWAPGGWLRAREITTLGGQTDVPTTIAALLGVDPDGLPFIGRNLLGAPGTAPVPLSHGQWASDRHAWIEAGRATGCYDIAARARVAEVVCAPEAALVSQTRAASQAILVHDLQAKLAGGSMLHGSIRQAPDSNPARGCC